MIEKLGTMCNPEHIDNDGNTAFICVCKNNMQNVAIKMIETFGKLCNIEHVNNKKETALIYIYKHKMKNLINVIFKI